MLEKKVLNKATRAQKVKLRDKDNVVDADFEEVKEDKKENKKEDKEKSA